jgi:hypothetical protein
MVDPANPFAAYVASLLDLLGSRDPFEVLAETPEALRKAVAGLTPEQEGMPSEGGRCRRDTLRRRGQPSSRDAEGSRRRRAGLTCDTEGFLVAE